MAKIVKRVWTSRGPTGHRVKRVAWGYSLQLGGKQKRQFNLGWSREDAEKALAARQLGIEEEKERAAKPMTFGEACDRYLLLKERKRSLDGDRRIIKHLQTEFDRTTPLGEITGVRIADYRAKRLAGDSVQFKRKLSPASINRPLALLRHLLRMACEEWKVIPTVPKIRLEKEAEGRLRYLTEEEITRLLVEGEKSRNPHLNTILVLALNTGMRRGEIMGLTWDRVDFSRGVIKLEITKSGKRREVPMNESVYRMLSMYPVESREGLVFKRKDGKAWGEVRKAFQEALGRAGIEDFRFHDLRHTCASWLVMRDASLADVQKILGHATLAMTMRYAHLSPAHLRAAAGKLDGLTSLPTTPKSHDFSTTSAQESSAEAVKGFR